MDTTPNTWRLRVELDDSPGALARVTIRLADQDCNVLSLSVIPVPGGVIDELVVRAGPGLLPADLVAAVRAEGGRCVGITAADMRDLVDAPTAALRAAGHAMRDPGAVCDALRAVLAADSVVVLPDDAPDHETSAQSNTARLVTKGGLVVLARRGWSPFTQVELARGQALIDLLSDEGVAMPQSTALLTDDGMAVVLRPGRAGDEEAVAELHSRCSMGTLFNRYHSGMRTVPRRWLHRLLSPPRGTTVVAQCADRVVAMGQLIPMSDPHSAEVSLLVEDGWQGRGVGTGLLAALAGAARADGRLELVGWCLPVETGLLRTAARAGLPTAVRREDGLLRVSITTGRQEIAGPGRRESASRQIASS
ncbi:GNAT superfamily N-acetyltransferase [Saccharothrix ecbatanensis]|uniref:GNAT superfamily N-acetyltransferase n=1 Tax=Saccharothrix ecbatanensis TaxID=1105145 RepID=A0A7W9HML3_9PSEU|nr:GNAT family N-acetyltransferase [Saccharothrix ecbatanensis]MBB5805042.1 GNAT superfamily N-acetyltransferase [Saccharothrix ecbatanensis]